MVSLNIFTIAFLYSGNSVCYCVSINLDRDIQFIKANFRKLIILKNNRYKNEKYKIVYVFQYYYFSNIYALHYFGA